MPSRKVKSLGSLALGMLLPLLTVELAQPAAL